MAVPGWPLFARWGASMASPRMTLTHSCSSSTSAMGARLRAAERPHGKRSVRSAVPDQLIIEEADLGTKRVSVSRTVAIRARTMRRMTHQAGSISWRARASLAEVGAA